MTVLVRVPSRQCSSLQLADPPHVLGVANAPAIFEGDGVRGRPIRLTLRHQKSRADGSLFLRLEVEKELA